MKNNNNGTKTSNSINDNRNSTRNDDDDESKLYAKYMVSSRGSTASHLRHREQTLAMIHQPTGYTYNDKMEDTAREKKHKIIEFLRTFEPHKNVTTMR
ncbi:hypothetical protein Pmar_PMAR016079 [Perkinsus marinus ATCC 50983]|uniref:Uncharacterized protein n=1 Tax=Perkinsus marinus (strain ATCC 50983 / TXsc) TaxID=423536 RepID=C5LYZ4_PERM5|nr:hypothetical protein Pmar_PMAR016079 [Perkinsus marinus ATCC 50983]EEQ98003.1 hypothetical protein Pmar_PMAR016079 [Perkinsus marinus ATCC 50983]|eukprot:XP_002765286.1 hypothetical protein Pmar_PMAR016079 [Perkinsus marinus ATCC 50983]